MTTFATRLQNGVDTAVRMRMADSLALWAPAAGIPGARSGFRNDSGAIVNVNAGTMNVSVSVFSGFLDGGASNAQAGYVVVNDSEATLTIADGDATQARVDVVAVVINDHSFDGSGLTDCTLTVVQGVPGGGAPTLPVTCLPIREINVPAGLSAGTGGLSSSNLGTDRRTYLPNGILRVASAAERDAVSVAARGTAVYRFDTDRLEVWNGSKWTTYIPDDYSTIVSTDTSPNGMTWASTIGGACDVRFHRSGRIVTVTSVGGIRPGTTAHAGSVLTNIPAEYRPLTSLHVAASPGSSLNGSCRWAIEPSGAINWLKYFNDTITNQYWTLAASYIAAD